MTLAREEPAYAGLDRTVLWIPAADVSARFLPGSSAPPWSWDDEERDIFRRECCCRSHLCESPNVGAAGHYQRELEVWIVREGMPDTPLCLGTDGRVWDGHHRIVAGRRMELAVPVLSDEWPGA